MTPPDSPRGDDAPLSAAELAVARCLARCIVAELRAEARTEKTLDEASVREIDKCQRP